MDRTRRRLLAAALAGLLPAGPALACEQSTAARVLVIGGGFGGSTCARTLRRLAPEIAVTLVEPRRHFYTGPGTNAGLSGVAALGDIVRGPQHLADLDVRWIPQRAVALDPVSRQVRLADGRRLQADYLVLSPGVALRWDRIEGLNARNSAAFPHAWLGDAQVPLLQRRLAALGTGATVAIASPPLPYRCPPGPYERASLFAWSLKRRARSCKILLLDAKDDFAKRPLFQRGWGQLYPGTIEWVPRADGGEVVTVDARSGSLRTRSGERVRADLACVIPPQRAADIAFEADLCDASGWCPVRADNFESARHARVHVIGDAADAQPMPKSAFSANSQAKLVALSIAAQVRGEPPPQVRLVNTCYSLLAPDYGISVGGVYGAVAGRLNTLHDGMSPLNADRALRAREAGYAQAWYENITHDSFG